MENLFKGLKEKQNNRGQQRIRYPVKISPKNEDKIYTFSYKQKIKGICCYQAHKRINAKRKFLGWRKMTAEDTRTFSNEWKALEIINRWVYKTIFVPSLFKFIRLNKIKVWTLSFRVGCNDAINVR